MSVVIGIDVGGSTTKIVGFRTEGAERRLIAPQFVRANDPLTSVYGAFGKFTDENVLSLSDISEVRMTGVGSSFVKKDLYGLPCQRVPEFNSIGLGGIYLSGLPEALIVSMGTGTALVHARRGGRMTYLGGTGVGGGTLMGLSKLMVNAETVEHILDMADAGDLDKIDLRIRDMTAGGAELDELGCDITASNFGNVSDVADKADVAAGILNLVFETVGMISVFGARSVGVRDVVLTGNLTQFAACHRKFQQFNEMYREEGIAFHIPELSQFSTVIGTALCD